eukprot:SAG11_NODE_1664_length_4496_cov_1.786218_1_plen_187_part_00
MGGKCLVQEWHVRKGRVCTVLIAIGLALFLFGTVLLEQYFRSPAPKHAPDPNDPNELHQSAQLDLSLGSVNSGDDLIPLKDVTFGVPTIARRGNLPYLRQTVESMLSYGVNPSNIVVMKANSAPHPVFESVASTHPVVTLVPHSISLNSDYELPFTADMEMIEVSHAQHTLRLSGLRVLVCLLFGC